MGSISSINPTTGKQIGTLQSTTETEITTLVATATSAKKAWKDLGVQKRVSMLRKVIAALSEKKEEFARLATDEMGMPIRQSRSDVSDGLDFFTWYLDNAETYLSPEKIYADSHLTHTVVYEPVGVAAVITPWNFPMSNFVWGVGQHLVAGNTVIYKTSKECQLFGKLLEETIASTELPAGVFAEIYGDGQVGEFLVRQPINILSFTGSSEVGKKLYMIAGERFIKAVMELGGSAPGIIFTDADIDAAIESVYGNRFINAGQMCDALKRLIVHESVFDEVVLKMKEKLELCKIGDPLEESTDIGPLVNEKQVKVIADQVEDARQKGAKIVTGGQRLPGAGAFYQPTILTSLVPEMRVWQEEVFGPVLPIVAFDTDEKAIRMANHTNYGLGSYIYTKDKQRAAYIASQIESDMVSINGASYCLPSSPFGGYKESGLGREHGKYGFAEVTQIKVIATEK